MDHVFGEVPRNNIEAEIRGVCHGLAVAANPPTTCRHRTVREQRGRLSKRFIVTYNQVTSNKTSGLDTNVFLSSSEERYNEPDELGLQARP
jgi:hypothetical protein